MFDINICNVFIWVDDSDNCILFIEVYDIVINFAFNSLRCTYVINICDLFIEVDD